MRFLFSQNTRRAVAVSLCVLMVVTLAAASVCLVCCAHHVCCGTKCPVCECVCRCGELLNGLGHMLAAAILPAAMLLAGVLIRGFSCMASVTLTAQRVRMNN